MASGDSSVKGQVETMMRRKRCDGAICLSWIGEESAEAPRSADAKRAAAYTIATPASSPNVCVYSVFLSNSERIGCWGQDSTKDDALLWTRDWRSLQGWDNIRSTMFAIGTPSAEYSHSKVRCTDGERVVRDVSEESVKCLLVPSTMQYQMAL
jgi:hypothetical protein